jgi:hypothetical protein
MQAILDHLDNIVRPALRNYLSAETALNAAHEAKDPNAIESARNAVMRVARTAAVELHQFADLVANEPTPQLPLFTDAAAARLAVKPHCVFYRTTKLIDDVHLLGDVADAFKHPKLNRKTATITGAKAVVTLGSGYGEMHFGEGKYGGAEQVLVIQHSGGKRALSAILQNMFDAWMRLLKQPIAAGRPVLAGVVLFDGRRQPLRHFFCKLLNRRGQAGHPVRMAFLHLLSKGGLYLVRRGVGMCLQHHPPA